MLPADTTLRAAAERFVRGRDTALPVADGSGRYLGTLAAHDVMEALSAGETTDVTALTRGITPLSPDASIGQALKVLEQGGDGVAIADPEGHLIGWVRHRDVLRAFITADAAPSAPPSRVVVAPSLADANTAR